MKILLTGGAGYIGSTIAGILSDAGHEPVVLDSFLTGRREFVAGRIFYEGDIADSGLLERILHEHPEIEAAVHCAALIVVPESESNPAAYYDNNVAKSLALFKNLCDLGVKKVIFSSSASVYGNIDDICATETSPLAPESPYARTKYMMEMILSDFCRAYDLRAIALRYFNPIGADPKLRTGVHVQNPTHVLGRLIAAAADGGEVFKITGTDWPTRDGSGVRDYIHVWDLARAHLAALERFDEVFANKAEKYLAINLGTGRGVTVKELVAAFEKVVGRSINKTEAERRPGDVAGACASADLAKGLLGWEAELSLEQGIADALAWQEKRKDILKF